MVRKLTADIDKNFLGHTYLKVEMDLRARIRSGQWAVGAMLPSRADLSREYGVAGRTLERAINNLLADGTLQAVKCKGTFVRRVDLEDSISDPDDDMSSVRSDGEVPSVRRYQTNKPVATVCIISALPSPDDPSVSHDQSKEWSWMAVHAVERTCINGGVQTRLCNRIRGVAYGGGAWLTIQETLEETLKENYDGIVVVIPHEYDGLLEELTAAIGESDVPVVCITHERLDGAIPHIYYDNELAGQQAAQHLIRSGYRNLVFCAPFEALWITQRIAGARLAARIAGYEPEALKVFSIDRTRFPRDLWDDEKKVFHADTLETAGYQVALSAFRAGLIASPDPSRLYGVIAPNDEIAKGILRATSEHGLKPGIDFGLVGFDDLPIACLSGITSLRPPLEAMGEEAARLLIQAMHGEQVSVQVRMRSHLIPRASTSRHPR